MSEESHEDKPKKGILNGVKRFYDKNYKTLMIIPIIILFLALLQIGFQTATTGSFLLKGVNLAGGVSIEAPVDAAVDVEQMSLSLEASFPENQMNVKEASVFGKTEKIIVEADIKSTDDDKIHSLEKAIAEYLGQNPDEVEYNVNQMNSQLGESFFKEIVIAFIIAFLFMGMVVFLYFGEGFKEKSLVILGTLIAAAILFYGDSIYSKIVAAIVIIGLIYSYFKLSVPSIAVILAAFSDILITLAIVNLMGFRLDTSGLAAFLMLIGYSVDTDVLLTTRLVKNKIGTIKERLHDAIKTGLTMNATTLAAVLIALFVTDSEIIRQIMTILLIGLFVDMMNTWIQNSGILRWYLEAKEKKRMNNG